MIIFAEASYEAQHLVMRLPPAAKFILYLLTQNKLLSRQNIKDETLLPKRTLSNALQLLLQQGFIKKIEGKALQGLDRFYRRKIDYREVYYRINI